MHILQRMNEYFYRLQMFQYPGCYTKYHIQQFLREQATFDSETSVQAWLSGKGACGTHIVGINECEVRSLKSISLITLPSSLLPTASPGRGIAAGTGGPFSCINFDFILTKHSLMYTQISNGFSGCLFQFVLQHQQA